MSESLRNHPQIKRIQAGIDQAAEIVGGPNANPLEVFPDLADKERRADIVWESELTDEQQASFREVMVKELGPGEEGSYGPQEASELSDAGYVALLEGGQSHKILAELSLLKQVSGPRPRAIIFSGYAGRKIGENERENAASLLSLEDSTLIKTEADLARHTPLQDPTFTARQNIVLSSDEFHRLELIGDMGRVAAQVLDLYRVPKEGKPFKRFNNEQKMILAAQQGLPVAFLTSMTYLPSREIAAIKVAEEHGVQTAVLAYGTRRLAEIKGTEPVPPTIAQLGAEAFKSAKLLNDIQ